VLSNFNFSRLVGHNSLHLFKFNSLRPRQLFQSKNLQLEFDTFIMGAKGWRTRPNANPSTPFFLVITEGSPAVWTSLQFMNFFQT
jgi:hypothetical protein